jgi:hypothetical protein
MTSFKDATSIDIEEAKKEIEFPVTRETAISENSHVDSNKDLLVRGDTNQPIGIISKKRPLIPYGEIMNWMLDEFDGSGVDYKLRESVVTSKGDLHQEYLFNQDINTPDGTDMSPLVIVKGSYIGKPLEIMFGTYRFTCSNGVIVGETIDSVTVSARESRDLLTMSLRDHIHDAFQNFSKVELQYDHLQTLEMSPMLLEMLTSEVVPLMIKKTLLQALADEGSVELLVDKIKRYHLEENLEDLYKVLQEKTAWDLYNVVTNIVSHRARSVNARTHQYQAISEFFGI